MSFDLKAVEEMEERLRAQGIIPSILAVREAADMLRALREEVQRLQDENFALAAGQCVNAVGDEGGTPYCKEIDRLRSRNETLERALRLYGKHKPQGMYECGGTIGRKCTCGLDALREQGESNG